MSFTYAQVEAALARLFNADPEVQRKTFRARIVHLRRVGIPLGFSPGRGKRIAYELEQVYQLGLCLELEEMGLDPSLISRLMVKFWAIMFYPLLIEEEQKLGFSRACRKVWNWSWNGPNGAAFHDRHTRGVKLDG